MSFNGLPLRRARITTTKPVRRTPDGVARERLLAEKRVLWRQLQTSSGILAQLDKVAEGDQVRFRHDQFVTLRVGHLAYRRLKQIDAALVAVASFSPRSPARESSRREMDARTTATHYGSRIPRAGTVRGPRQGRAWRKLAGRSNDQVHPRKTAGAWRTFSVPWDGGPQRHAGAPGRGGSPSALRGASAIALEGGVSGTLPLYPAKCTNPEPGPS